MNGDGKVTVREVDSLMALQFKAAHETLTGRDVKRVLAEQFRRDDGRLERRWLGISSNVTYRYAECGTAGESGNADAGVILIPALIPTLTLTSVLPTNMRRFVSRTSPLTADRLRTMTW